MRIQSILILATAIVFTGCSQASNSGSDSSASEANNIVSNLPAKTVKTKAVLVYADWCGSCKALDPKLKAVKAAGTIDGLEFVTLDYTDKDQGAFFAAAMGAGVEGPMRDLFSDGVKTGQLILIDADDQRIIEKVTKSYSEEEIAAALKKAVNSS